MPHDHDEGLARIDSMLDDYVTWEGSIDSADSYGSWGGDTTPVSVQAPSHLPMVATPEEAERGQWAASRAVYTDQAMLYAATAPRPQTQNTLALVEQMVAARVRRHREDVEAQILSMISDQLRRQIPNMIGVQSYYDLDFMATWVIASNEHVQTRWEALSRRDEARATNLLVLRLHSMRPNTGHDSWGRVRDDLRAVTYVVEQPVMYRDRAEARYVQASLLTEVIDATPFTIAVPDEVRHASSMRGYTVMRQVVGEFAEAMAGVGVAATQAAAAIDEFRETAAADRQDEPTLPAAVHAPIARRGLDGQRSTYGPPQRGRRR